MRDNAESNRPNFEFVIKTLKKHLRSLRSEFRKQLDEKNKKWQKTLDLALRKVDQNLTFATTHTIDFRSQLEIVEGFFYTQTIRENYVKIENLLKCFLFFFQCITTLREFLPPPPTINSGSYTCAHVHVRYIRIYQKINWTY